MFNNLFCSQNSVDESYSALVTLAVRLSGAGEFHEGVQGTFTKTALEALCGAACTASSLIVDGDLWVDTRTATKISRHGGGFGKGAVAPGSDAKGKADVSSSLPAGRALHDKLERHNRLLELMRLVSASTNDLLCAWVSIGFK